jgi:hypothetical protein
VFSVFAHGKTSGPAAFPVKSVDYLVALHRMRGARRALDDADETSAVDVAVERRRGLAAASDTRGMAWRLT